MKREDNSARPALIPALRRLRRKLKHFYDAKLTLRDRVVLDDLGRVVTRISESQTCPSATSSYEYADDRQVLSMNGRTWSYDAQGRATRIDYGVMGLVLALEGPLTSGTRLTYECL